MTHTIPPAPKDEIVRWYIEQALSELFEFLDEEVKNREIDKVFQYSKTYSNTLLRALELAVRDVG